MSKFSSFKNHQLITERWRKFLSESGEEWYGWQESKLREADDDYADTAVEKLNTLWVQLRDEGTLGPIAEKELIAQAGLEGDEVLVLSELWEISGVFWSADGPKKDAEGNTIRDERGLPVGFFAPDDPEERAGIEAELDARERTGGARPGEQIGIPGFGQEE